MTEDTFEGNFTWYEWTFVAPEEASGDEDRVAESPFANLAAVGEWGDEWVWTM
jgi:hypothetical protein